MTLSMGTVRWVQWVRYGGYGGYGTVGTVQWVQWVRYGGYGGYGTVGAGTHPPYPPYRTHRTVPTVPTVPYPPYPPYRTHRTHRTVPTVPTYRTTVPNVPHPSPYHHFWGPYPPTEHYSWNWSFIDDLPDFTSWKRCFSISILDYQRAHLQSIHWCSELVIQLWPLKSPCSPLKFDCARSQCYWIQTFFFLTSDITILMRNHSPRWSLEWWCLMKTIHHLATQIIMLDDYKHWKK